MRSLILFLCLMSTQMAMAEGFRYNNNDSWNFSAHDKQAHFLGGMYVERALFNRFHETMGEKGHIPALGATIAIGWLWEVKDGYVHNILGDPAGYSKQDWGYVVIGAVSSTIIELSVSKIIGWIK